MLVPVIQCAAFFFFQAEDCIRDVAVTGVQTCALPISGRNLSPRGAEPRPRELRYSGIYRRCDRSRNYSHSGSDSRNRNPLAFLPGIEQRDVRQGAGSPANGANTLLATQSLRRFQSFFLLGNGELPRKLRLER